MTEYAALEPHGAVTPLFDNVWTVTGSVVMMPLVRIPRTMVILRSGSELTLVNAVRLDDEGIAALAELGTIKNVVRIGIHGMDDAWYIDKHAATLWAPPGMTHARGKSTAAQLRPDSLPMTELDLFQFEHTKQPEAALLWTPDKLLITCDSVQNWEDTTGCSVVGGVISKFMGFVKPAQIGPPWRKMMTPKGGTLRPDFERLAALDFKHLVGGHGVPLKNDAPAKLRESIVRVFGA